MSGDSRHRDAPIKVPCSRHTGTESTVLRHFQEVPLHLQKNKNRRCSLQAGRHSTYQGVHKGRLLTKTRADLVMYNRHPKRPANGPSPLRNGHSKRAPPMACCETHFIILCCCIPRAAEISDKKLCVSITMSVQRARLGRLRGEGAVDRRPLRRAAGRRALCRSSGRFRHRRRS